MEAIINCRRLVWNPTTFTRLTFTYAICKVKRAVVTRVGFVVTHNISYLEGSTMRTAFKLLILLTLISFGSCTLNTLRTLIQDNLLGNPVVHKEVKWYFDPDEGIRRSRLYQEVNGVHGEKAIERLGLGIDGYDQERLAQQRARDAGHLGGLNDFRP